MLLSGHFAAASLETVTSGSGVLGAALLEQSRTVWGWLSDLSADDFARPSVLPGWDVRTLTGHLILVHRGLGAALGQPTRERPLSAADYVRRNPHDPDSGERSRATASDHPGSVLVAQLDAAIDELAAMLSAAQLPSVIYASGGPIRTTDLVRTRIVEVVVHADDLTRSLSERAPVPLQRAALSRCTRALADILAAQQPGRSVEVRVPPYAAVQCAINSGSGDTGPTHSRGTPPNVVETDPLTFLRLATGRITWDEALAAGTVAASGLRADLARALPMLS